VEPAPVVVIVPMPEEARALRQGAFAKGRTRADGACAAVVAGRRVLLVVSGMGKVRAAAATARVLVAARPGGIVVAGLAGSLEPSLAPGDVVVVERAAEHDIDLTPLAPRPAVEPGLASPWWEASPPLVGVARSAASSLLETDRLLAGPVATGDELVTGADAKRRIRARLPEAVAVDMETAAVAKVAALTGVPWCALRMISDAADERFDPAEVLALLDRRLSAELAALVVALVARWPEGSSHEERTTRGRHRTAPR
jgi:adenosylhomocysteine nucleosidase